MGRGSNDKFNFRHIPLSSLWDMQIELPGKQSEDQEQSGQRYILEIYHYTDGNLGHKSESEYGARACKGRRKSATGV